jgi:hypothetical protein
MPPTQDFRDTPLLMDARSANTNPLSDVRVPHVVENPPPPLLWEPDFCRAAALRTQHVEDLVSGHTAAIVIPDFYSVEVCEQIARTLDNTKFPERANRKNIDVHYIGLMATRYRNNPNEYVTKIPEATQARDRVFESLPESPLDRVFGALSGLFEFGVRPARVGDSECYVGIVRDIRGGEVGEKKPIHRDDAAIDLTNSWGELKQIKGQLAWNLYFQIPDEGGELTIFDRRVSPSDTDFKLPGGRAGYSPEICEGVRNFTMKPTVGSLVLFDSTRLHLIEEPPSDASKRRFTIGGFIGVCDGYGILFN